MRIVICQRCERERRLGGGAGSLCEPPAGRELRGSVEQVGEDVQHPTHTSARLEGSLARGPGAPGPPPTLLSVKAPTVVLMDLRCFGADHGTYNTVLAVPAM